jgi:hypothetical protein
MSIGASIAKRGDGKDKGYLKNLTCIQLWFNNSTNALD